MNLLNGPTEEQMKLIKLKLNEDDERFENNLNLLKTWISFQDHLPKNYDPKILPIFLRGCKHNLERAKTKVEMYFTVRGTLPELYASRDPTSAETMEANRAMAMIPLPNLNKDGCRVSIVRLMSPDASIFNIEHIVRLCLMIGDVRVSEERPLAGDVLVVDGRGVSGGHCARLAAGVLGRALAAASAAYPQRLQHLHVVHAGDTARRALLVFKALVKEKIRQRVIIHRNPEDLFEHISPEILPEEYGGTAGSFTELHDRWQQCLVERRDWFKEQESVAAKGVLPKHLAQSCALDSNEGVQGSFRKLAID